MNMIRRAATLLLAVLLAAQPSISQAQYRASFRPLFTTSGVTSATSKVVVGSQTVTGVVPIGATANFVKNGTTVGAASVSSLGIASYGPITLVNGDSVSFAWTLTGQSPAAVASTGPTLASLTVSPTSATAGSAYSGTISGKTSGSTITASSSDGTALAVSGSTVTGTFAAAGSPTVTLTETLSGGTNSPRTSTFAVSVYAATAPPAAPSITATAGNAQVSIAWTDGASNGAAITSHKLYRGTVSGSRTLVGTISTASPYVDTGLTNGTPYYYSLSAVNSAGEGAQSAQASATPVAGAVSAYLGQAAYPTYEPNTIDSTAQSMSTTAHIAATAMTNPVLYFANWCGVNEAALGNDVTHIASIEYPIGQTPKQVVWGSSGATSGVATNGGITPAAYVPGGVSIPKGAKFLVHTYRTGSGKLVRQGYSKYVAGGDKYTSGATVTNDTLTIGGSTAADQDSSTFFGPVVILDMIAQPSVLLPNDSITQGVADAGNSTFSVGPYARALAPMSFGHANLSMIGRSMPNVIGTYGTNKKFLAQFFSHSILALGANDHITAGMTAATMQSNAISVRQNMLASVPNVFLATTTPAVTNYTNTVSDQQPYNSNVTFSSSGVRQTDNNWRRTTPSGFAKYYEVADFWENSRDDGHFKVPNYTTDGIHLNQQTMINFAAGGTISASDFTSTLVAPTQTVPTMASTVATTTTLSASNAAPSSGTSITLTATLSHPGATGTVTFKDGATTLGTGTLTKGVATFSTSALAVGSHSLTAVYGGATGYGASTSSAVTVTVASSGSSLTATTTSLSASSTSPASGASVTFTATVAPSAATGTVTFADGGTTLGTGTLSGGTATYSTSALASGSHSITAAYGGDSTYAASTSSAVTVTVAAAASGFQNSQVTSANRVFDYDFTDVGNTVTLDANGKLQTVTDQGPNGLTLSPATAARPSMVANAFGSRSAPDLNGAVNLPTSSTTFTKAYPITLVMVYKMDASPPGYGLFFDGKTNDSGAAALHYYSNTQGLSKAYGGSGSLTSVESTGPVTGTTYVDVIQIDASGNVSHSWNGAALAAKTPTIATAGPIIAGFAFGGAQAPAYPTYYSATAQMGMAVAFDGPLSQSDLDKVVGRAAWRYGAQGNLSSNSPYRNAPP